jgi:hypothetical protein
VRCEVAGTQLDVRWWAFWGAGLAVRQLQFAVRLLFLGAQGLREEGSLH